MSQRLGDLSSWIYRVLLAAATVMAASAQPYAYVANGGSATYSAINVSSSAVSQSPALGGALGGVAVTPDGSTIYTSLTYMNTVSVVSTSSNSVVASIGVGTTPGHLAISPNGSLVYVIDQASNQVSVISTATRTVTATIGVGSRPVSVAFSPDGTRAYVANLWGGTVSVINTSTSAVINTFSTGAGPSAVAVTPDGQHIYVTCQSANTVTVHNTSGAIVATIPGFTYPVSVAITSNGSRAYVVNESASSVSIINTATNSMAGGIAVGSYPTWVVLSGDGTQAYVTNEYGFNLSVINTSTNSVIKTIPSGGYYPIMVATVPGATTQGPPPTCTFTATPQGSLSFTSAGGSVGISVTASASSCSWTASGPGWTSSSMSPTSWLGNGTATLTVGSNNSNQTLNGSITVAGKSFNVTESGLTFTGVRLNCGGSSFTDSHGNVWQADPGRNTSSTMSGIAGADIAAVYQKEAYSPGGLTYTLTVPPGSFTVKLRFAEIYLTARGQRVVNIYVNGALLAGTFDILAYVGTNTAHDLVFPGISSSGNQITIQITPVTGSVAKLSGIEIY